MVALLAAFRTLGMAPWLSAFALLSTPAAQAHDPSAWGGMFRTRDFGGSWLSTDAGLYIGAALAVAIHPTDPNHLLYATDTRLLRSRNGGRDWAQEAADLIYGPTLAVAFDRDGGAAAASSSAGIFVTRGDGKWAAAKAPSGAAPARVIVPGNAPGHFLLGGPGGIFRSVDGGQTWTAAAIGDAEAPAVAIVVLPSPAQRAFAIVGNRLWASRDEGATWQPSGAGLPGTAVDAIAADADGKRLWVAAADRFHVSDGEALRWQPVGQALPQAQTTVRALVASPDGRILIAATHRGVLRSTDHGVQWQQTEGALPVHLESGMLQRDVHDAQTLYCGFSLSPYADVWRRAAEGNNLLSRIDPINLAGGAAFLILLVGGGIVGARALSRSSARR
ncbi:MAG: hypothetical protein U1F52_19760 [Burkholderiales bacterium]